MRARAVRAGPRPFIPQSPDERAVELGGAVTVEPFEIESVGRIAVLKDPQGAAFSIIHAKPAAEPAG